MQHGQEESEEWRGKVMVRADELEVGQKIAEGKYGTVYKGKCRGQSVAIKILHNQHLSNEKLEELRTEVEIMSRLRHPCILLLMGVCTDKDKIALVMEYVEGKSLDRILHDSKINLSLQTQLHIAKDIAKGMNWLHCLDPPIIHRDIKPPNILVNASYDVKVCDFGLSCVKEIPKPDEELRDTAVGSPIWMAPEVLSGHLASEKSDVYAFAIVLWEIMTRKSPFSNVRSFDEFLDDVIDNHKRPPLPDDMDANLKKLIEECWSGNAKKRPNFSEILDRLDDILINMLIKDAKGKELWRSMKNKEYLGEHYPFFAAFSCFNEQLCKTLGLSKNEEANLSGHHGYACFKIIIGEYYHSLYSTADSVKVTCESWGKFVDTFGPLESGMGLFNRLEELCSKQWFHGAISSEDAEKRLKTGGAQDPDKKKGYFLVRLSSNPQSCFTISRFDKRGAIVHQRITRDKGLGHYLIKVDKDVHRYESLVELVDDLEQELYLKTACSESRDFGIVFLPTYETNGYLDEQKQEELTARISAIKNAAGNSNSPSTNAAAAPEKSAVPPPTAKAEKKEKSGGGDGEKAPAKKGGKSGSSKKSGSSSKKSGSLKNKDKMEHSVEGASEGGSTKKSKKKVAADSSSSHSHSETAGDDSVVAKKVKKTKKKKTITASEPTTAGSTEKKKKKKTTSDKAK
eukprot:TRINITY_DN1270_c0_g1_i2.p1 TRINITY_DN1270_c0_g1~~TRINITY_DN1270_c0_g1_i2.p1  ORF type:complete len:683 (-),score=166.80 TRINITY_DN1270_c0_g1_i2:47-2095(-)